MARKTVKIKLTGKEKQLAREQKRRNKLNSLKNEFEGGKITGFDQVFAIVSETSLAAELGISFYNFRKKVYDPGEFTVSEMMRFSALIGVSYPLIAAFILERMKDKKKG